MTKPVTQTTLALAAKKSYRDGHVAVSIRLKCGGYNSDRAKIESSTELTIQQARALAQSLIDEADKAAAKVEAKAAAEDRRKKYREREIAAGRMIVMRGLHG